MCPQLSRVRGNGLAGLLFENVDAAADARPFAHHRSLGQLLRMGLMRTDPRAAVASGSAVPSTAPEVRVCRCRHIHTAYTSPSRPGR